MPSAKDATKAQTLPVTEHMGFPSDWEARPIWHAAIALSRKRLESRTDTGEAT